MTPEPIPVSNFKDFVAEVGKLENRHWVFRGHGRVGWQIESSLARYLRSHQRNILKTSFDPREAGSIQTFRKSAHLFLNHLPDRKDTLSWLAVMQHFGAPTRIIDFTFSPYVALFFAASEAAPKIDWGENPTNIDGKYESFEVHAIQQRAIRDQAAKVLGISDDPLGSHYCIGAGSSQQKDFVSFFQGEWQNARQTAQQGLFMVPSKIDLDIHSYLMACRTVNANVPWKIFRFPGGRAAYKEIVMSLLKANITAESLFPGLEGIARSLQFRWYEPRVNFP